jgi:hypothetical protein
LCIHTLAIRSTPSAQRVWASSFSWWGKHQIDAAAVDVEGLAQMPVRHGRALDVPPGPAQRLDAARARPGRLARARRLPQHEVHGVALVGRYLDAGAGQHLVQRSVRQLAVVRHRRDMEQHVVLGHIGAALIHQLLDHRLHVVDVPGGARLDRRLKAAERRHIGVELAQRPFGDPADRFVQRQIGEIPAGARVDLVVDVGDVAHVGDVIGS